MVISRKIQKYILILFCSIFILNICYSIRFILFPYAHEFGEGLEVILVQRFLRDWNFSDLYPNVQAEPYVANPYTPIYHLIHATLYNIFQFKNVFLAGRIISIFSFIGICIISGLLIRSILKNNKYSLLGFFLVFFSPHLYQWSLLARVDMLGIFFSLFGVYLLINNKQTKISFFFGVLSLALSFFTKQLFISAAISYLLYIIFFEKNIRKSIYYSFLFSFICSIGFFFFNLLSDNNNFLFHITSLNLSQYYSYDGLRNTLHFFLIQPIFSIILFFFIFSLKGKVSNKRIYFFYIYFIISFFVYLIMAGKIGAWTFYYRIENYSVFVIIIVFITSELIKNFGNIPLCRNIFISCLFCYCIYILSLNISYIDSLSDLQYYNKQYNRIVTIISSSKDAFFFEEPNFAPLVNNTSYLFDPFIFTQLSLKNKWDDTQIVYKFQQKKFHVVILNDMIEGSNPSSQLYQRCTPKMINAIQENYIFREKIADKYLYYPKK